MIHMLYSLKSDLNLFSEKCNIAMETDVMAVVYTVVVVAKFVNKSNNISNVSLRECF